MDFELMEISGVSNMEPLFEANYANSAQKAYTEDEIATFGDIFTSAIENVRTTEVEKNQLEYLLAIGELDNPATLTIAATKAQVAVELLASLRTKALEAHSEIMRMSI